MSINSLLWNNDKHKECRKKHAAMYKIFLGFFDQLTAL